MIVLIYGLTLPYAVWLLAQLLGLLDDDQRTARVIKALLSVCVLLGLSILTDYPVIAAAGWAFVTVTVLHVLTFWALMRFGIGVPRSDQD